MGTVPPWRRDHGTQHPVTNTARTPAVGSRPWTRAGGVARGNPDHPTPAARAVPEVSRFVHRVLRPRPLAPVDPQHRREGGGPGVVSAGRAGTRPSRPRGRPHWAPSSSEHGGETVLTKLLGGWGLIQMSCLDRPFFAGRVRPAPSGPCAARSRRRLRRHPRHGPLRRPMTLVLRRARHSLGHDTRLTNRHLWPVVEEPGGGNHRGRRPMRKSPPGRGLVPLQPATGHRHRARAQDAPT